MQNRNAIGSRRRRLLHGHLPGKSPFDGAQRAEGVERLDQPPVGLRFFGEEDVDLTVEKKHDRAIGKEVEADPLLHGDARCHAAHVADLEIEQHKGRIDRFDGRNHVGAGPDTVDQVDPTESGFDVVDEPIGVGGKKNVRHGVKSYTACVVGPLFGHSPQRDRVWRGQKGGYYAPVLEITTTRPDDNSRVDLCPDGELDAYSVAQFREAFAELASEPRVIVNLSGVQFMDSAGLGALIGGIRNVREGEGRVTIFSDREAISKLLHTTGFDRIVPVKDVLDEAIAALDEDPDA